MLYQLSYIGPHYSRPLLQSGCITSFRRTHDFTANSAKIAIVSRRILWSGSVVHASTPKTAYTAMAIAKRFKIGSFASGSRVKNNGAQGRIRTSVARKERQIYSLLPLTTRPPVQKRRSFGF